jgi:phosphatidylinositol alpha-mannosyltransferase
MRICIVSDSYYPYPSGVSEHAHNLAETLRNKGHEVAILTLHYPKERIEEGVQRVGRVLFIPMNGTIATVPFLNPSVVRAFFMNSCFDVVHLHGPFFPGLSHWALKYSPAPCVATFHTTGFSQVTIGAGLYQRLFPFYKWLKARIGVSPVAVEFIKPYIPGTYEIVPNGVDTSRFSPDVKEHGYVKKISGKKILFLGRLDTRKGLAQLLPAFALLVKEMDVHLIVAGSGPERSRYEHFVDEHNLKGRVHFLGFIPNEDLASIYRSCDAYCSPALGGETFGIVLIEAMASGTPVAASRIAGYQQVINDGENGLLFDPRSPDDIKAKFSMMLADEELRRKLIDEGLRSAKSYDWSNVADRILEIYERAIEKSAGTNRKPTLRCKTNTSLHNKR